MRAQPWDNFAIFFFTKVRSASTSTIWSFLHLSSQLHQPRNWKPLHLDTHLFHIQVLVFILFQGSLNIKDTQKHSWCSVDQMFNLRTFSHLVGKLTNNLLKRIVPSNRLLLRVLHLHINTFSSLSTLSSTFYVQKEFDRHSALKTNLTQSIRSFNITTAK